MSQKKELLYTKGPLVVAIGNKWPFRIQTMNSNGDIVFSREMPCSSTRDKCPDDTINGRNFRPEDRKAYSDINKQAIMDEIIRAATPEMYEAFVEEIDRICPGCLYKDKETHSICPEACFVKKHRKVIEGIEQAQKILFTTGSITEGGDEKK